MFFPPKDKDSHQNGGCPLAEPASKWTGAGNLFIHFLHPDNRSGLDNHR